MDSKKDNYPEHLEDIEPDDYILDDTLSGWNREKRPFFKRLASGSEAPFILLGIGLVVVIALFFFFAPKEKPNNTVQQMGRFSERFQQIEEKIVTLDASLQKLAIIENDIADLQKKIGRLESVDASAALRIDRISKDFNSLKQEINNLATQKKTSAIVVPSQKKAPAIVAPPQKKAPVATEPSSNESPAIYHQVQKGETLYRISQDYKVSIDTIYRLNSLSKKSAIYPGQKLLIRPAGK